MRCRLAAALLLATSCAFAQSKPIGRPATQAEIQALNYTVLPTGEGLPEGHGTATQGQPVFKEKCAPCHNEKGEGKEGQYPALVGGVGTLATNKPLKTVGSVLPHATTLFDYIRRAMPYDHPRSLNADQVYALTAYILYLNGIVPESQELNKITLPQIKMPNRDGFEADPRPDTKPKH